MEEQKVVAVVLGDIGDGLTHAMPDIRASLNEVYGTACKKDFYNLHQTPLLYREVEKALFCLYIWNILSKVTKCGVLELHCVTLFIHKQHIQLIKHNASQEAIKPFVFLRRVSA